MVVPSGYTRPAPHLPVPFQIFEESSFTVLLTVLTTIGVILSFVMIPMQYGYGIAHLNASSQDLPADIGDLFCGYKRFWHVLGALLLMSLAIAGGLILLIIPGVILSLAYAMVPFVLRDNPELSVVEVLRKSRMMMDGHKWELFLLVLSFIGWMLLGVLTLFIGYLWLIPYMQMTEVKFYEQLRAECEGATDGNAVPEEL